EQPDLWIGRIELEPAATLIDHAEIERTEYVREVDAQSERGNGGWPERLVDRERHRERTVVGDAVLVIDVADACVAAPLDRRSGHVAVDQHRELRVHATG